MCSTDYAPDEVRARVEELADELNRRGLATTVLKTGGHQRHPCIRATNKSVTRMSEDIYAAPAEGKWYFWWSWAETIAPVEEVEKVAVAISCVLDPFGQSAGQV
jgi:hypothetical protein